MAIIKKVGKRYLIYTSDYRGLGSVGSRYGYKTKALAKRAAEKLGLHVR